MRDALLLVAYGDGAAIVVKLDSALDHRKNRGAVFQGLHHVFGTGRRGCGSAGPHLCASALGDEDPAELANHVYDELLIRIIREVSPDGRVWAHRNGRSASEYH